jgi:hypothetical protein
MNNNNKKHNLTLQAVLFDKDYFDTKHCRHFLKIHKITPLKRAHTTENYYRYRIRDPHFFDESTFRTVQITPHVKYVMGVLH